MLKQRFQLLLLTTVVLVVYYSSISNELNSIDDVGMVTGMLNLGHWSLKDLFLPSAGVGLYYRPLLSLSFLMDNEFWFMDGSFMHLENILLHLFNAFLVYILALKLLPELEKKTSYLPLVAALCFGLHPITTESVNWVSGRTDLMAGSFLLLCTLSLVLFKVEQKYRYLLSAALGFLCATLSKEVSLAFLLGAFFLLNARSSAEAPAETGRLKRMAPEIFLLGVLTVGLVLVCFYLRTHPYTYGSSKLRMTFRFIFDDPYHALFVFLRTFGFYLKKLYWPFPLNFTIMEVDPLYELLAMPIVLGCGYLAIRRSLVSAIFLAGVCMITPAFIPAFNQVAWTPYAERYVYVASAFVTLSTLLFLGRRLGAPPYGRPFKVIVSCLLVVLALVTFQRNRVWGSNLSLYADTVKKSPTFSKAWNELGIAYCDKRDWHNAEICFARASVLYSCDYDEISDLNLAAVLRKQGKEKEAVQIYKKVLNRSKNKSIKTLNVYSEYLDEKASQEKDPVLVATIRREELHYRKELYALTKEPLVLFQMGNISRAMGDRKGALAYYREAYEKLPPGNSYKVMARMQLKEIEPK